MAQAAPNLPLDAWLPLSPREVAQRGWTELDVVLVSGDAYIDHPSFGTAVIGRILESLGLRVAIIAQPAWRGELRDFRRFGTPRMFFAVTGGCMDSMVSNYTAAKRPRSEDAYSPGGERGHRPDYASVVYCQALKSLYPDVPILLGGIEASLRRVTHYDYWSDRLKPSIVAESGADLLVYGMGEKPLREIVRLLQRGVPFGGLTSVPQTAYMAPTVPKNKSWQTLTLASHATCLRDKMAYARNFMYVERESNKQHAARLIQDYGERQLVINPPYPTMTEREMDSSFDLPYTRLPHPKYSNRAPIPAWEMIKFSINTHRGCFGGCAFCTISAHQGKLIANRSEASILNEVRHVVTMPGFKGYISDVGGPSANMYGLKGFDQAICDMCARPSCIHPTICKNLDTDHNRMVRLYERVSAVPGVKKMFVGSGIRYDLLVHENNTRANDSIDRYLERVVTHHVSGRLKVAPEHTSDATLALMRKPSFTYFHIFKQKFDELNRSTGQKLQLIPYFISSHPGTTDLDSADLACETKAMGFKLEQVQDFTPTPMTLATEIYYSGYHPYTLERIHTARSPTEKKEQNMFFFWYKPEFRDRIRAKLMTLKRPDLIRQLLDRS